MKKCTKCGGLKPLDNYRKDKYNTDGLATICKDCHKAYEQHPDTQRRRRERYLLRTYGIDIKTYNKMLREQNHSCGICFTKVPGGRHNTFFMVDHCHDTGEVRALLCDNCNKGLGCFQDNPEILIKASEYVRKYNNR